MRKQIKIPRILKINSVNGLEVSVVFNNGESRIIDFNDIFREMNITKSSALYKLLNPEEFKSVKLNNFTLSWENIDLLILGKDNKPFKVPFEIGPDVLFAESRPIENENDSLHLGRMLKRERLKSGLTQDALAAMSGTSKAYISRIENEKSGIELSTLKKIVETGLGKQLNIRII